MDRFARVLVSVLLLAAAGLVAGCGSGGGGLLTGSTPAAADAPAAASNDDPSARPMAVAWTSARAQHCGFYFDPAKLRASYLKFEGKQPGADLAKAEKTYDTTFKTIRERVAGEPDYCTETKNAEIKKDLVRHLAGDFKPDFPKPKVADACGFFGCAPRSDDSFDQKKFWEEQQTRNTR
jgi:hypothetical protein